MGHHGDDLKRRQVQLLGGRGDVWYPKHRQGSGRHHVRHGHLERVIEILQDARKLGITVSPTKFYFGEPEVKFVGYLIGREGIRADPAKLKAITEFPTPKGISDLRSFDGMVNQVAYFASSSKRLKEQEELAAYQ